MNRIVLISFFRSYGYRLFLILGALSMLALLFLRREQYGLSKRNVSLFWILLFLCGIVGVKLLFFIESGGTSFDGMSFFGCVFLVPIVMPILGHTMGIDARRIPDLCAPCGASILAFVRFGCFCAGCCGGVYSSIGFRWPTQLMESFGDLLIVFVLLYIESMGKQGVLYPVFLISYGCLRFLIEFLRDSAESFYGLTNGQLFAIFSVITGTFVLLLHHTSGVKNNGKKTI